jgi:prepilin-type N-terminal cleavage/methylation domain-containing protein
MSQQHQLMKSLPAKAFTLIELLVVISIIAILASLALPAITGAVTRGQMVQSLNNAKQIHLATQQAALDATSSGISGIGWPGDIGAATLQAFVDMLVSNDFLKPSDASKLFSAPPSFPPATFTATNVIMTSSNSAFAVYRVADSTDGTATFLLTKNWSNSALTTNNPYGQKGFVILRKAGDAQIGRKQQATDTNFVSIPTGVTALN